MFTIISNVYTFFGTPCIYVYVCVEVNNENKSDNIENNW